MKRIQIVFYREGVNLGMLTFEEAKVIGKKACIEKLGIDFFERYRDSSIMAYGDFSEEGVAFCYVGIDDQPIEEMPSEPLILSNEAYKNPIPFFASCNVILENAEIVFLDCALPDVE